MVPVKTGFAQADLSAALPPDHPVRDGVMARAFHAQNEDARALWVVLDLMDLNRPFVEQVRDQVALATRVPSEHVHVVATHNHAASELSHLDARAAAGAAAEAAGRAVDASQPALMRYAEAQVEPALTLTRRRDIAELGGALTCFYGVTAEQSFCCAPILRQAVRSLVGRGRMAYCDLGLAEAVPQEAFIDAALAADPQAWRMPPGDPLLQALQFVTDDGAPIGTIVRFACHVVNCNGQGFYSGDFPFFLTRSLEERLGGGAVFLNGPCADIAPATPDKRAGFERTMGARLAEATATALAGQPAVPLTFLRDLTMPALLPCRRDFPADADETARRIDELGAALAAAPTFDLPARQRLAEQIALLSTTPFLRQRWEPGEEPEHLQTEEPVVRVELGGLRLNEVTLLGFPGETFRATAAAAAACRPGGPLITVTEHGRTAMYVPPPGELARGGYEFTCRLVDERGEPALRDAAAGLLRQLGP